MTMAEKKNEFPPSVEADRRLLAFETWEDYLDSLIDVADLRNLRSLATARTVAALGYRANGDTLGQEEFIRRRARIQCVVFPVVLPYVQASERAALDDALARALAVRERANRLGVLQTIIFVRYFTRGGFEVSGYIDFAHRLLAEDWAAVFAGGRALRPRGTDLAYYHWRHGTARSNMTRNYKPIMDPALGLLFQNRHDHKLVCPQPGRAPGQNTTKQRVRSARYTQTEIYDHVVRRKS